MLRLLIKGSREDAALALARRDIPVLEDLREASIYGQPETVARVHDAYRGRAAAWLCEQPFTPPFPVGTLLYYSETELGELLAG
jgi:hypothetical protein